MYLCNLFSLCDLCIYVTYVFILCIYVTYVAYVFRLCIYLNYVAYVTYLLSLKMLFYKEYLNLQLENFKE